MYEERTVRIGERPYTVVLSDERTAILSAQARGMAVIGIKNRRSGWEGLDTPYLAETPAAVTEIYLEQVVRRFLGLPWTIAETKRLRIREFSETDARFVPREPKDAAADRIFYTPERLREYIRYQYGFYEYGIWALEEKTTGELTGKAGIVGAEWYDGDRLQGAAPEKEGLSQSWFREAEFLQAAQAESAGCGQPVPVLCLELGYHIFEKYRRMGYGTEACLGILAAVREGFRALYPGQSKAGCVVYAQTDASNEASVRLLRACGFRFMTETDSGEKRCIHRYGLNL